MGLKIFDFAGERQRMTVGNMGIKPRSGMGIYLVGIDRSLFILLCSIFTTDWLGTLMRKILAPLFET